MLIIWPGYLLCNMPWSVESIKTFAAWNDTSSHDGECRVSDYYQSIWPLCTLELLRLETAMSTQIAARNSLLAENIQLNHNIVTHLCWDNFDLNEETPSGSGSTHSTHGIVFQEVCSISIDTATTHIKIRQKSITYVPKVIQPYYAKQQVEHALNLSVAVHSNLTRLQEACHLDFLWIYTRHIKAGNQTVPSWHGWNSMVQRGR